MASRSRSKLRGHALALGTAWLLAGAAAAPLDLTAQVQAPSQGQSTYTLVYTVHNTEQTAQTFTPQVTLPGGWQLLQAPSPVTLQAGERHVEVLVVLPPLRSPAGSYPATIQIGDAKVGVDLPVLASPALVVATASAPIFTAGDYEVVFQVTNPGNVAQRVVFSATNSLDSVMRVTPGEAVITPGQQQAVRVQVRVPTRFIGTRNQTVTLRAQGLTRAAASATTEVLASQLPLSATYHTLPLAAYVTTTVENGHFSSNWGVAGEGDLPSGATLGFTLGSGAANVSYRQGPFTVGVGYQGYGQLGLASPNALGVRATYTTGRTTLEGNARLGLRGDPADATGESGLKFGVGISSLVTPQLAVAADVQQQRQGATWGVRMGYTSLNPEVPATLGGQPQYTVDASASGDFQQTWRGSLALGVRADDVSGRVSYSRDQHGEAATQNLNGVVSWTARPVTFTVSGRYGNSFSDAVNRWQVGVTASGGRGNVGASASYRYSSAPASTVPQHDTVFRVRTTGRVTSQQLLRWTVNPGHNLAYAGTLGISTRYGTWSPGVNVNASLDTFKTRLGASLGWQYALTPDAVIQLGVARPDVAGDTWSLSAGGTLTFRNGSALGIGSSVQLSGNAAPSYSVRARYDLLAELPYARRENLGTVAGRVTDQNGQPVPDLVIRLGPLTATTDPQGRYAFPAVPPGAYYLLVDPDQLGAERVATPALPRRLEVMEKQRQSLDIQIAPAGTVTGQVQVEEKPATPGTISTPVGEARQLLAGLPLELHHTDGTVVRATSDEQGRFAFVGLQPGHWTLVITPGGQGTAAPRYQGFLLEVRQASFDLTGGEALKTQVSITPRTQEVQVEEGGTLTPTPAPATPGRP